MVIADRLQGRFGLGQSVSMVRHLKWRNRATGVSNGGSVAQCDESNQSDGGYEDHKDDDCRG